MHTRDLIVITLAAAALAGCSGSGGGSGGGGDLSSLSLSGGSIPTGGGSVKGLAVLPSSQPLTGSSVTVRALATAQTVPATPTFNADGSFVIRGLPVAQDLELVFQQTGGATLKVIVPAALIPAASAQPVDIGTVSALTTVVAQCLEQETLQNPDQEAEIVAGQLGPLTSSLGGEHQDDGQQDQEIHDGNQLTAAAITLIDATTNAELQALASTPSRQTADAALDGLVGRIGGMRGVRVHLSAAQHSALITAQLAGTIDSPAALASDLSSAGATVTAGTVAAADATQRNQLTGWADLGPGITSFEALAIATDTTQDGGLTLSQAATDQFLNDLLGTPIGDSQAEATSRP